MSLPRPCSLSVATVGSKGQIVIPLEVREKLKIAPGDKIVLLMKDTHGAVIFPMDGMRTWLDTMTAEFDELTHINTVTQDKQGES